MKKLALLALVFAGTASAKPQPKSLFAIDVEVEANVALPTSHFEVLSNGHWTFESDTKHLSGQLSRGDVAKIAQLAHVPWRTTMQKFKCMAYSASFTNYSVNGHVVYTSRMCDGKVLDTKSRTKLDAVLAIVNPLEA